MAQPRSSFLKVIIGLTEAAGPDPPGTRLDCDREKSSGRAGTKPIDLRFPLL